MGMRIGDWYRVLSSWYLVHQHMENSIRQLVLGTERSQYLENKILPSSG